MEHLKQEIIEHKKFNDFKTIEKKVIWLLETNPYLRDSDDRLYNKYIAFQLGDGDFEKGVDMLEKMSAKKFLILLVNSSIVNYDTLTRARRKVQEKYPHLRGDSYVKRKAESEHWKNNINNY
jgi:hypothetical protein